jgi:hypothetical protein
MSSHRMLFSLSLSLSLSLSVCLVQQPTTCLGLPIVDVYRSHTPGRTPLNERSSPHRGRSLHNIQQTQEAKIHYLRGIQTRDPSNQAAAYLHFRRHGHWDRLLLHTLNNVMWLSVSVLLSIRYTSASLQVKVS